jgi:LacI family transcriptional regulator/LacI family repressor for deo operon, udp, cdd, tsx, nupC, and nupG
MPQNQITMKDIAKALGVSVATVSRALADHPGISEARRKEIQEYAKEHNFVSNALAESLRHSKARSQKIIGVIVPEIVHYFFSTVVSGIEEEASNRGYSIIVAQSKEQFDREVKICDSFIRSRVCGVIVSQAKNTKQYDHFIRIIDNELPLVFFDRICTGVNASRVVIDDYHGAFTATKYLIDTGCKRIAFCGSSLHLEIVKNRMNGYKDALRLHEMNVDNDYILECDSRELAEQQIPEIMKRENRPDAFFCINDDTAIGVIHAVKRLGLKIPDDVSICGFTNGERAKACDPMLTTMDQRGNEIGHQAANILINKVEGITPLNRVDKQVVRTNLVVRDTTKAPMP